jgi:hypothetical protein
VPPTVPTRRVRVCLHAGNTKAEVDALVERVDLWLATRLGNGILPGGLAPGQDEDAPESENLETAAETDEDEFLKALL